MIKLPKNYRSSPEFQNLQEDSFEKTIKSKGKENEEIQEIRIVEEVTVIREILIFKKCQS